MSFKPCFVIPTYNHHAVLNEIVAKIAMYGYHCIIVDDASGAETRCAVEEIAASNPFVRVLRRRQNGGKGAAVIDGLREAERLGCSHAIQVDADGQHELDDLPKFINMARNCPDALVSGQPVYDKSVPTGRLYGRYITHFWVCIETLSFDIKDSMCGYRVYPVKPTLNVIGASGVGMRMDFDIEVMVRMYWSDVPVVFIPTPVCYRQGNSSNFRLLADNVAISWMHTRLCFGALHRLPALLRRAVAGNRRDKHWSIAAERGSVWGIGLMRFLYKSIGIWAFNVALYPVITYFFLTGFRSRRASLQFLRRVYDYGVPKTVLARRPGWTESYRHFLQFGIAVRDKMSSWLGHLSPDRILFEREQEFFDIAALGRGGVIIGAHLGNIEVCRARAKHINRFRMNVLVLTSHAAKINRVFKELSPDFDVELIHVDDVGPDVIIGLKEKIDQGEFVSILADRTSASSYGRVCYVEFLGHKAPFSQGPFVLASLLQCPVYLMFCMREGDKHRIYFEHFSDQLVLPRRAKEPALQGIIERFVERLQHYAMLYPLQWFNFFDFWQTDDPGVIEKG